MRCKSEKKTISKHYIQGESGAGREGRTGDMYFSKGGGQETSRVVRFSWDGTSRTWLCRQSPGDIVTMQINVQWICLSNKLGAARSVVPTAMGHVKGAENVKGFSFSMSAVSNSQPPSSGYNSWPDGSREPLYAAIVVLNPRTQLWSTPICLLPSDHQGDMITTSAIERNLITP